MMINEIKIPVMTHYNWNKFERRIALSPSVDPLMVYQAWVTRAGIESWFLRQAIFTDTSGRQRADKENVQTGDTYEWLWFGYDDSTLEKGTILSANDKDSLKFTFSGGSIVTISVGKEQGEIICSLVQEMPMEEELEKRYFFIECSRGWTFYLANLKSILQGGIDLRNKNVGIHNVVNA